MTTRLGIVVPQGWTGEYAGWDASAAWQRSRAIAQRAEAAGAESLWVYDHVHTTPEPTDEMTFEAFTTLGMLAASTSRVRLGQLVTSASYRNPALLAKMISTLDVASDGRMELGLGAGWKREEFEAYGFDFATLRDRQEILEDTIRIVLAMLAPGRASLDGRHRRVQGAINEPKPIQGELLPILVGGNGRDVTWRIAARWADELNLDAMPADELPGAMDDLRRRCEEAGRDPATLRVSVHLWWEHVPEPGAARVAYLRAYADAGVSRVMTLARSAVDDLAEVDRLTEDAALAGFALG